MPKKKNAAEKRRIKRKARKFAYEVVDAPFRIKGSLEDKRKQKKFEREIEKTVERFAGYFEKYIPERRQKEFESVITIIVNLIFLYMVNNVLSWNLPILAQEFSQVIWAFNLSIIVTIVVHILYLFAYSVRLGNAGELLQNLLGVLVLYLLYRVFPFAFSNSTLEAIMHIGLLLALVISALVVIFRFFKLLYSLAKY